MNGGVLDSLFINTHFPWSILFSLTRGFLIAAFCLILATIGLNVLRMVSFSPVFTEIRVIVEANPAELLAPKAENMTL